MHEQERVEQYNTQSLPQDYFCKWHGRPNAQDMNNAEFSEFFFSFISVLSQQCYNRPNCAGDVVPEPTTAEECCVGTDEGMSYGISGGTCTVSQCIGNR